MIEGTIRSASSLLITFTTIIAVAAVLTDRCTYKGNQYRQGETWTIGCDQECVCEQAAYGYYRCHTL